MGQGHSMLGFVVIVILYAVIGFMAAAGTIFIARKILSPKAEQISYAAFLMMIAAFYLVSRPTSEWRGRRGRWKPLPSWRLSR
jgi:membrane protease YdiL (CAAX protease family)